MSPCGDTSPLQTALRAVCSLWGPEWDEWLSAEDREKMSNQRLILQVRLIAIT
ncbi:MAG: hypothetical protein RRZ73_05025 [Oscillospiraceae bacterium]